MHSSIFRKSIILQHAGSSTSIGRDKKAVHAVAPDATLILYGSYARGDDHEGSDIDVLVLLDTDKVTYDDRLRITHSLFPFELEARIHISPLLRCRKRWEEKQIITPFYKNVRKEGILL